MILNLADSPVECTKRAPPEVDETQRVNSHFSSGVPLMTSLPLSPSAAWIAPPLAAAEQSLKVTHSNVAVKLVSVADERSMETVPPDSEEILREVNEDLETQRVAE